MFYIPVQFSKSFPLSFRTARWLSHLVSPLSTCFFTNFSGWLLPSHSVHSKISSLFSRLISCQSSPNGLFILPHALPFGKCSFLIELYMHACISKIYIRILAYLSFFFCYHSKSGNWKFFWIFVFILIRNQFPDICSWKTNHIMIRDLFNYLFGNSGDTFGTSTAESATVPKVYHHLPHSLVVIPSVKDWAYSWISPVVHGKGSACLRYRPGVKG